jgi:hypothetical protein
MTCGLVLAAAATAAPQSSEDPYRGIYCPPSGCSPEDLAWARAREADRQADLERRYKEQQALAAVPTSRADLTLVCGSDTVQIWFGAGLMAWGVGADQEVWRLDKVSPAEITFKRVASYVKLDPDPKSYGLTGYVDAEGIINRVTGGFSRTNALGYDTGRCEPTPAKF